MASPGAVAKEKAKALEELNHVVEVIGGRDAVRRLQNSGRRTRDPEQKHMLYLKELAAILSLIVRSNTIRDDTDLEGRIEGIGPEIESALKERGIITLADVRHASDADLLSISGIGPQMLRKIRKQL